ncbi:MAG: hypothetical protein K2K15_04150 [Anaeroplasmataceae bacterium]|nr:hypothetical protein [Anaeroplasmataceae bacterium]
MNKDEIQHVLDCYGISFEKITKQIDSSREDDYRLNIVLDNQYVLRVNDKKAITEQRVATMERLVTRYNAIGIYAPHYLKTKNGFFTVEFEDRVCYVSEYADYPLASDLNLDEKFLRKQVVSHLGVLAKQYTDFDLIKERSAWSIIDLSPLDNEIDEKQENLNSLVATLKEQYEEELAEKIIKFNEENRRAISKAFHALPRCVFQGDLNDANLLMKDESFFGIIDFNLSGTEVNINCFLAESNSELLEDDFKNHSPKELLQQKILEQDELMQIILKNYELNTVEKEVYENYRNIILISQYPNVCAYQFFLESEYKDKMIEYLNLILER